MKKLTKFKLHCFLQNSQKGFLPIFNIINILWAAFCQFPLNTMQAKTENCRENWNYLICPQKKAAASKGWWNRKTWHLIENHFQNQPSRDPYEETREDIGSVVEDRNAQKVGFQKLSSKLDLILESSWSRSRETQIVHDNLWIITWLWISRAF